MGFFSIFAPADRKAGLLSPSSSPSSSSSSSSPFSSSSSSSSVSVFSSSSSSSSTSSSSSSSSSASSSPSSSSASGVSSLQDCACFSRFLHDKRVIQEQVFLERHIDAYHLVACLLEHYPPHLIQNDADLVEILYRFSLTDTAYKLLEQKACAENLREKPKHFSNLVQKLSFCPSSFSSVSSSSLLSFSSADSRVLRGGEESPQAQPGRREGEKEENGDTKTGHRLYCGETHGSPSLPCRSADCGLRQFCERGQAGECSCMQLVSGRSVPRGQETQSEEGEASSRLPGAKKAQTAAEDQRENEGGDQRDEERKQSAGTGKEEDEALRVDRFRVLPGSLLETVLKQPLHPLVTGRRPNAWHSAVAADDMRVYVRNYEDNRELLTFRIEGDVEAPLEAILSVLNEVDLFKNWVPYFSRPFKLGLREVVSTSLGRVDQIVQFHVDFPWPLSNRDALFEVWAVDDFERNSQIAVKMTTLDHESPSPRHRVPVPKPAKDVERMCVDGNLVIVPRGSNASFLRLLWHTNCRMHVPLKMVDFVSSAFQSACKAAMTGEHEARRAKNRFLYGFIEARLSEVGLSECGTAKLPAGPEVSGAQTADTDVHGDASAKLDEEDDEFFDAIEGDDSGCAAHSADCE
ncbi:Homology to unknown gene, related [Neospora caninum Liverpool]|uniref:START-2 domain protein n=1 Tax=Neospora caninum (strain Liverpool) TaxID=572307 RepID=F0VRH9_NEOCL|nr:Homology to unknown gene, related [Neospora caninum Liverpool]CBZ56327.1 Homology to unknown gene, related [Neospora caninum Liverpool]|eukprot:XP_003886352.1 Homology to unknown gene, related [Neospora caninum Liverpool]